LAARAGYKRRHRVSLDGVRRRTERVERQKIAQPDVEGSYGRPPQGTVFLGMLPWFKALQ
jgi:hypothetical protein